MVRLVRLVRPVRPLRPQARGTTFSSLQKLGVPFQPVLPSPSPMCIINGLPNLPVIACIQCCSSKSEHAAVYALAAFHPTQNHLSGVAGVHPSIYLP